MKLAEYADHDALGLMHLVRRREVSAAELQSCAIEAAQKLNPALNFLATPLDETPVWQEGAEFSGLPFLIKEGCECLGYPLVMGSRLGAGLKAAQDGEIVARLKRAGVAVIGATTSPEFGLYPVTESTLHGPTRNPWSLNLSPGGSSGGASAAVAAGVVPVAQGSDGGGSIRGPAHCVGLFGLKPTRGRTPMSNAGLFGFSHTHVLTRSVRDSAAFLDILQGPEPGARFWVPPVDGTFLAEVSREPGQLRVGLCRKSPLSGPLSSECLSAMDYTAGLLARHGHQVEDVSPPIDWQELFNHFLTAWTHSLPRVIAAVGAKTGHLPGPYTLDAMTRNFCARARSLTIENLLCAEDAFRRARLAMDHFFESYDLWVTPTGIQQAPEIGEFSPCLDVESLEDYANRVLNTYSAFTPLLNITGHPAASVPVYHGRNGLPAGTQIIARMGGEATILRVSAQLEAAACWASRRPPNSIF